MKKLNILYYISSFVFLFLFFISCSNVKEDGGNVPYDLKIYFHNKENTDKIPLEDLDITLEYTNPKGKTTILTNDELFNGVLTFKSLNGLNDVSPFKVITDPYSKVNGIELSVSFFTVNYPNEVNYTIGIGVVKKFKIILRKKGDDKIIFENSFTYKFENKKESIFVDVESIELEKKDLDNVKTNYENGGKYNSNLLYHIYLD